MKSKVVRKAISLEKEQERLDKTKWIKSEKSGYDRSGSMPYCEGCPHALDAMSLFGSCNVDHDQRVKDSLCAENYRKLKK